MLVRARRQQAIVGRLLNEFLVGLGLLFFALVGNLAILNSATDSSAHAALSARALELARGGMEELINNPKAAAAGPLEHRFGSEGQGAFQSTFYRKSWLVPLTGEMQGLNRVTVVVEWEDGSRAVRLERYVRES